MVLRLHIYFFADDLFPFAEASGNQAGIIREVLNDFCHNSGQKVNVEKTTVFFSKNVLSSQKRSLCQALGFRETTNFGKFLSMPLIHEKISKRTYNYFLDMVARRCVFRLKNPIASLSGVPPIRLAKWGRYLGRRISYLRLQGASVMHSKYRLGNDIVPSNFSEAAISSVAKGIRKVMPKLNNGLLWAVGNGRRIRFCLDAWVDVNTILIDFLSVDIPHTMRNNLVFSYVTSNVMWDTEAFPPYLPRRIVHRILAISVPSNELGKDSVYWGLSPSGTFTIKSAYGFLGSEASLNTGTSWKLIWKWPSP
ncbi:uncharacterized protein LOC105648182 [Jatropha curcas]|uniref:uncharacterized protein LOC105648182 n=1 Tax=Jatropha curcas TaxID=180498 RepID=UPI0018938858|nr:uncharacterized protein LOC105648182 [Jatropha curcas]